MTWDEAVKLLNALQKDGYTVSAVGDENDRWEVEVTGRKANLSLVQPGDGDGMGHTYTDLDPNTQYVIGGGKARKVLE